MIRVSLTCVRYSKSILWQILSLFIRSLYFKVSRYFKFRLWYPVRLSDLLCLEKYLEIIFENKSSVNILEDYQTYYLFQKYIATMHFLILKKYIWLGTIGLKTNFGNFNRRHLDPLYVWKSTYQPYISGSRRIIAAT
jgi:hypothetical protein